MSSAADDDATLPPTLEESRARSFIDEARDDLKAVADVVDHARASLPGWDNLAFLKAFARAAEQAKPLLSTTTNPLSRRLIAQTLLRLVPPALLPAPWSTSTPALALHLDDAVLARADNGFALSADDAPRLHPSWSAFLARPGLLDGVLARGRHEHLLCARSLSPGAERGTAVLVRVDEVKLGTATVRVLSSDGTSSSRRLTSDGKDAGPAEVKLEVLKAWLENAGPGARALDLRKADDRALWLAFAQALKARRLDVLLAKECDPARRADVVEAVVDAAADVVAGACLDPLSCRFVLPPAVTAPWSSEAARLLEATGLVVEVSERPRLAAGNGSKLPRPAPSSSASSSAAARHFVWLDAVCDPGVVGGALSAVGQARAFGRLAVSFLAPLGALPTCGAGDGNGVVVNVVGEGKDGEPAQRGPLWVEPAWPASPVTPLLSAWKEGRGLRLPDPKGAWAHDVRALPDWLGHFGDAIEKGSIEKGARRGSAP